MIDRSVGAADEVRIELARLDLLLRRHVLLLRAAKLLSDDDPFRGLYVSDTQVEALLEERSVGDDTNAALRDLNVRIERERAASRAKPLRQLATLFGLDAFELDALLLAFAPELDLRYERVFAYVQNDITRRRPTVDLALRLLCTDVGERLARRAAFAPDAPLLGHELVRLVDDPQDRQPPRSARWLKADDRIVDFVLGHNAIDARLAGIGRLLEAAGPLRDVAVPDDVRASLANAAPQLAAGWFVLLYGAEGVGKRDVAAALAAESALPLLQVDLAAAILQERPLRETLRLARREALLRGGTMYLARLEALLGDDAKHKALEAVVVEEVTDFGAPVLVGSAVDWRPPAEFAGRLLAFQLPVPAFPVRRRIWEQSLSGNGFSVESGLDVSEVAGKFALSRAQIEQAARRAESLTAIRPPDRRAISAADLHAAARAESSQGLKRLAQKVEPFYEWDDIVLPPGLKLQLRDVCASIRYRHVVYDEWGFDRKLSRGKGLHALFSGPSGTGKTMAAEVIARDLALDLYKIDLSTVVSKYIGDTERRLREIFDEAQTSNSIVFFDECDALLGKRSEVKDAHDRYSNIEVAYLLQKLEEHEGAVILATNFAENMDEAFVRRMHHRLDFPFPDARLRERIWRLVFPHEVPLSADIDFEFLAGRFELSGGHIRNAAVAAAFLAAESGAKVSMSQLIRGIAREFQKLGRLPSRADFGPFYETLVESGEEAAAETA